MPLGDKEATWEIKRPHRRQKDHIGDKNATGRQRGHLGDKKAI